MCADTVNAESQFARDIADDVSYDPIDGDLVNFFYRQHMVFHWCNVNEVFDMVRRM